MRTKKNIVFLIENGLSINTVSKMTDNQVKVLVEKFKKENKEQTQVVTQVYDSSKPDQKAKLNQMLKDNEFGGNLPVNDNNPQNVGTPDLKGKNDGMPTTEGEIKEKFQSKSQQGLFWARCNKCSDKKCKWCKMAKEFSDSTSKKDYKKMPEKKRPEKTNESSQKYWENKILEMLEEEKKRRKKTPKKESETMILRNPKKMTMFSDEAPMELPIAKMFSIGKK